MTAAARQTGTEQLRARVLDAAARRTPLRIMGAGRWLDANRPVQAPAALGTRELAGIVEYVPGDLTITVGTGTTLAEIARTTGEASQFLALDPFGDDEGTIGATVATASTGPLGTHFGTPRDAVLGLEFVTGDGKVVRGGGRVVKNVAGFDLARLLVGSWGTLGVITEVTLRLRARPEVDATLAIPVNDDPAAVRELRRRLASLPFTPFAAELLNAPLARQLGLRDGAVLLARFGGNASAAAAQRQALASLGDAEQRPATVWSALRATEPSGAVVVRLSQPPSRIGETWREAGRIASALPATLACASLLRGIVRCVVPAATDDATLRAALASKFDGIRIFERLPAALWPELTRSPVADRLSRGIRRAYDPHHLLNPGILGEMES